MSRNVKALRGQGKGYRNTTEASFLIPMILEASMVTSPMGAPIG